MHSGTMCSAHGAPGSSGSKSSVGVKREKRGIRPIREPAGKRKSEILAENCW